MLRRSLGPAHLGWRMAQSLTDDLLVSAAAVAIAAPLGILPRVNPLRSLQQTSTRPIELLRSLTKLVPAASLLYGIYWVVKLAYHTGFLTLCRGKTPACKLFGLQVVMVDQGPITWRAAAGRTLAGGILGQIPALGQMLRLLDYLVVLFNRRRQALRDIAVGTMLVHSSEDGCKAEDATHG